MAREKTKLNSKTQFLPKVCRNICNSSDKETVVFLGFTVVWPFVDSDFPVIAIFKPKHTSPFPRLT